MSSLKDAFADDGSAKDRISRVVAKNKAAMKKAKSKNPVTFQPMEGFEVMRADEELPDQVVNKFKTVDFMNLFLSRLPKRVTPVGFDEPASEYIFKALLKAFFNQGASKRGVMRCMVMLAKNIQRHLSDFKLPLTELNLRRFSAYKEGLAARLEPYLLVEGSIELLLASDSAENEDYELTIRRNDHVTELTLTSLTEDKHRTFRFLNTQIKQHIQNREILREIENHAEREDA